MNKISICLLFILIIASFALSATAPVPQVSSTPLPSPSLYESPSPSPTAGVPICIGQADISASASRTKTLAEIFNPEVIRENLKSAFLEIYNAPNIKDFLLCKYPPTFKCPSNCIVKLTYDANLYFLPDNTDYSTMDSKEYAIKGSIYKSYNLWQLLNMGISLTFNPGTDEENDNKLLDIAMPLIMAELQNIKAAIDTKGYSCPEGYIGASEIHITGIEMDYTYDDVTGLIITGRYAKIYYTIAIQCFKQTGAMTSMVLKPTLEMKKECINIPST